MSRRWHSFSSYCTSYIEVSKISPCQLSGRTSHKAMVYVCDASTLALGSHLCSSWWACMQGRWQGRSPLPSWQACWWTASWQKGTSRASPGIRPEGNFNLLWCEKPAAACSQAVLRDQRRRRATWHFTLQLSVHEWVALASCQQSAFRRKTFALRISKQANGIVFGGRLRALRALACIGLCSGPTACALGLSKLVRHASLRDCRCLSGSCC